MLIGPTLYLAVKYLHVLGAIVILGAGAGIAFFMLMAHRSDDAAFVARTSRVVVLAHFVFTATVIVAQPLTGFFLMRATGARLGDSWIVASLALFAIATSFWLPVVWMQRRMQGLAERAAADGAPLPPAYHRLFRLWFIYGVPGFGAVLAILWLMVARPVFGR
jgi:uncharacterized membrane protein